MSQMPDSPENRRTLDSILCEITAREEETPRQRFACDLLNTLATNTELVAGVPGDSSWRDLPEMAEKCLEAAGKIYPEPSFSGLGTPRPPTEREVACGLGLAETLSPPPPAGEQIGHDPNGAIDPDYRAEILRQHALMEGIIERLDTDVEARRRRWGGLDKVPINPGGRIMPLGAIVPPPPAAVEGAQAVAGGFAGEDNFGEEHRKAIAFWNAQDAGEKGGPRPADVIDFANDEENR